jgi:hypothetical protein
MKGTTTWSELRSRLSRDFVEKETVTSKPAAVDVNVVPAIDRGMWLVCRVTSRQMPNRRMVWAKSEGGEVDVRVHVNDQRDWRPGDRIEGTVERVDGDGVTLRASQGGPRWNRFGRRVE